MDHFTFSKRSFIYKLLQEPLFSLRNNGSEVGRSYLLSSRKFRKASRMTVVYTEKWLQFSTPLYLLLMGSSDSSIRNESVSLTCESGKSWRLALNKRGRSDCTGFESKLLRPELSSSFVPLSPLREWGQASMLEGGEGQVEEEICEENRGYTGLAASQP